MPTQITIVDEHFVQIEQRLLNYYCLWGVRLYLVNVINKSIHFPTDFMFRLELKSVQHFEHYVINF